MDADLQELTPVVAAIVVRDGAVLLVRRRIAEGALSWQFPAGELERGEAAEQAAARETREELGLLVRPTESIGERIHPLTRRLMIYVACQPAGGTATLVDSDELAEVAWCRISDVERYLTAGVFPPVLEYLNANRSGL